MSDNSQVEFRATGTVKAMFCRAVRNVQNSEANRVAAAFQAADGTGLPGKSERKLTAACLQKACSEALRQVALQ